MMFIFKQVILRFEPLILQRVSSKENQPKVIPNKIQTRQGYVFLVPWFVLHFLPFLIIKIIESFIYYKRKRLTPHQTSTKIIEKKTGNFTLKPTITLFVFPVMKEPSAQFLCFSGNLQKHPRKLTAGYPK